MPKLATGGSVTKPSKKKKPSPASGAKPASSNPRAARAGNKRPLTPITKKSTRAKDNKYLTKVSGTTKKEVQGVRANLKTGRMTKKQAVKALNESGNRKRVKRALSR